MADWVSLNVASKQAGKSRWALLFLCLDGDIEYRRTANGVEIATQSVRKLQRRVAAKSTTR